MTDPRLAAAAGIMPAEHQHTALEDVEDERREPAVKLLQALAELLRRP